MIYVKRQVRSKGTTHAILLKILASGRCKATALAILQCLPAPFQG